MGYLIALIILLICIPLVLALVRRKPGGGSTEIDPDQYPDRGGGTEGPRTSTDQLQEREGEKKP